MSLQELKTAARPNSNSTSTSTSDPNFPLTQKPKPPPSHHIVHLFYETWHDPPGSP